MSDAFDFDGLVGLLEQTHRALQARAARSVDVVLVVRNWLFGYYIVEFEHGGADRAELYGKALIDRLATSLSGRGLRGISPTNLRKFRAFYEAYPGIQQTVSVGSGAVATSPDMRQTLSVASGATRSLHAAVLEALTSQFKLGWSHYAALLTLGDPDERRFYELEAVASAWSVRELERQIGSGLYERLALSRDKDGIRRLSAQGLAVEKAADRLGSFLKELGNA
jgi:hypothetical protein